MTHCPKPKLVQNFRSRLDNFRIDENKLAETVAQQAMSKNHWAASTACGGEVSAAVYMESGKAPLTEVALAVSDPEGMTVVWIGQTEAYAVTSRKAADKACSELENAVDLFDKRVSRKTRLELAWDQLREIHRRRFSPMELLARAAD